MNILHKLGLYRASEVEELIETTNEVVETAAVNNKCFKVAMRLVNEANSVEHAVKVISEYCANTTCTECGFTDAGKGCKFVYTPPAWWSLLEVSK